MTFEMYLIYAMMISLETVHAMRTREEVAPALAFKHIREECTCCHKLPTAKNLVGLISLSPYRLAGVLRVREQVLPAARAHGV